MKFFKKALVASAILGTVTAANAATVASTPIKLSAEGVMYKVAPTLDTLTFDIVVKKDHPSSSTITLTFDENVEFDTVACAGAVTQVVGTGTAFCGDIGFNYGTGSYTFDNVVVTDGDASKGEVDSISFDVRLGNPLYANSGFRVIIGNHGYDVGTPGTDTVYVTGASNLQYASEEADGTAIETGTGIIATEQSQFGFTVTTALNGVIERENQVDFINLDDSTYNDDVLAYTLVNDETLGLALVNVAANVVLKGNFEDVDTFNSNAASLGTLTYAGTTEVDTVTNVLTAANITATETKETITLGDSAAVEIPVTGDVSATAIVTAATNLGAGVTLPTGGHTIASVNGGEWILDATIINVPYFPVGFDATSTSVHIANEGGSAADVIVTGIDDAGTEYGPYNLGMDLAAHTVTKISQGKIMSLFGIDKDTTDGVKLSVTFNIDADEENVSAYAYTQKEGQGRSEVSNSQLKGK